MKQTFSPEESIRLISEMIAKAKTGIADNGHLYLVWGWTVFFCGLIHFALQYFYNYPYIIWIATIFVLAYSIYYVRKQKSVRQAKTHYDEIITGIWVVFVLLLVLQYFLLIHEQAYHKIIPGLLLLYGMPLMLMGILFKHNPLITGAIACWLLAVISVFFKTEYHPLFLSVSMLIAWIRPGYLIKKEVKTIELG